MSTRPSGQAPGYTLDLLYPSRYVVGQAPLQLQWVAASAGAPAAALTDGFCYLDLGCGDGSTINLLAACYPEAKFFGVDISEAHITAARDQAHRAGLDNVTYFLASFADLETLEMPEFEYIAASGVYSWINQPLRQAIDSFTQKRLKPGGIFGVHYSSLPGAAVSDPLIGYLQALCATKPGTSVERFTQGLADLRSLSPVASFFANNPQGAELIQFFSQASAHRGAHDVLNRQLPSLRFADVYQPLSALGLEFLGSGNLLPNYPELSMSTPAYRVFGLLTGGADRLLTEATKDLILNTARRFDLYRKPDSGDRDAERVSGLAGLGSLRLERAFGQEDVEARRRVSRDCAVDLTDAAHTAVLNLAGETNPTIAAVLDSPELGSFPRAELERAIERLFAAGFLYPLIRPPNQAEYRREHRYRLSSKLNAIRLEETALSDRTEFLASPILGSPIKMPQAGRLGLLALTGGDFDSVWSELGRQQVKLIDTAGIPITRREQFERALPRFAAETMPRLLRIGIVEAQP